MRRLTRPARCAIGLSALLLAACTYTITPEAGTITPEAGSMGTTRRVSQVELLGVITVAHGATAYDTPVGGLSGLAYDDERGTYYFLSDDRATFGPARIYRATLDLRDGRLEAGDLTWTGLIRLRDEQGAPFAPGAIDPEGVALTSDHLYVASEGHAAARPPLAPAVMQFTLDGDFVATLPVPEAFRPTADGRRGVRNNRAFEGLAHTPDGRYLLTGVENALVQDGPAATLDTGSPARLLRFDLQDPSVTAEALYRVAPIPVAPILADGYADNGLTALAALDAPGGLLALERSYVEGVGNTVRLYVVATQGALDETDDHRAPVAKELLADFGELGQVAGVAPDNLEGMALGPQLPDGRRVLVVVSDNNFNPSQTTQIWALALTLESVQRVDED